MLRSDSRCDHVERDTATIFQGCFSYGVGRMRYISFAILFTFVTWVIGSDCFGQGADRRGQFFDGVLRNLIDNQISSQPAAQLVPVPSGDVSPQMREARNTLQQFANELQQLYTALRQEERYTPGIRSLLADSLQAKAAADVLVNRSQGMTQVAQLAPEYEALDRQWRVLAHRVQQWPNLGSGLYQRIDTLNVRNERLGQLLKVAPQLETGELVNLLATLNADFDHLSEDIRIDLVQHPERDRFIQQLRQLQSMVYYMSNAVTAGRSHDEIVGRFKQMFTTWLPLKGNLRVIDNRYIQRNLARVAQANNRMHELLWIPRVIDGNEILFLATTLKRDVDHIADQVTLRKLIESPNAKLIFEHATDFYTLCGDFRQTVTTETDLQNLKWDFRELDVSWNDLRAALSHSTDPKTLQYVATVDSTVSELRSSLGERPIFDSNETLQLVESIDSMADLLHFDINRSIANSNRYPRDFRTSMLRSSQTFHRSAHSMHQQILQQTNDSTLRRQTANLASQWDELQGYISRASFDRPETVQNAQQIAQMLAKLQVIYAY